MAHDRAAKIDRPNFTESEPSAAFDRTDSYRISHDRMSADRVSTDELLKSKKLKSHLGRIVTGGVAQKSGMSKI